MKNFIALCLEIDGLTATNDRKDALIRYFRSAPEHDIAWAVYFLSGRRLKSAFSSAKLRRWFLEWQSLPEWLYDESYAHVGDTAEAVSLLVPATTSNAKPTQSLATWVEDVILPLMNAPEEERKQNVLQWWSTFDSETIFVVNKIMTGAFRLGISERVVFDSLAKAFEVSVSSVQRKLIGDWDPRAEIVANLRTEDDALRDPSQPYPFFLAAPLDRDLEEIGDPSEWSLEWKWDGIRGQIVRRENETYIWSRGEELVTKSFPELVEAAQNLPNGTVLDGEIMAWKDNQPLPFHHLQKRLGRKRLDAKILAEVPVHFIVYDLLEHEGKDIREVRLEDRLKTLTSIVSGIERIHQAKPIELTTWDEARLLRPRSREFLAEGLMIKRKSSKYGAGRKYQDWWKFKVDPLTCDVVLIYAQAGSGRRSNLYTDYTFAAWKGDELVPVAKAYSGLDQQEIEDLDRWIRRHTMEKFGPVRSVKPVHVFELGFEGIGPSSRHKSGVALRFPRILRWRHDKPASEADRVDDLLKLISNG